MKLSIITINYNNANGLKKTIESVVGQTQKDFEYLIIDGGSNDGSVEVIKQYADKINYWVSEPDKGIYDAMNKGILAAKGEYLLFLNSGDVLVVNKIMEQVMPLLSNEDIIYGNGLIEGAKRPFIIPDKLTKRYLRRSSLFHPSSFIKKELFLKNGLYNDRLIIVADWEFFLKNIIINKCSVKKINLIVSKMEEGGVSRSDSHKNQLKKEIEQTLDNYFPHRIRNKFINLLLDYIVYIEYNGLKR